MTRLALALLAGTATLTSVAIVRSSTPDHTPVPAPAGTGVVASASAAASATAHASAAIAADRRVSTAIDAARWIDASAITTNRGTVWPADPNDPKTVNTSLYSGTPGVVLFFLELHHATGKAEYLARAKAGGDHLLAAVADEKGTGLYSGIGGIGFTLGELFKSSKEPKYRDGVKQVVTLLEQRAEAKGDGAQWTDTTDIVSGNAGTGLFLLWAAREFQLPQARALAVKAGRRSIAVGEPAEGGLKWAMDPKFPRQMPNFSHGTAGIAYFLATLYQDTKEQPFLDAALKGARYLQAIAETEGDVCLIFHHEPDGKSLHYLSWCHGPTGTARLFYRLSQVTRDPQWMDWVKKSARGVMKSGIPDTQTPGFWNNVSQCCGSAGVADFFLDMHRLTGDASYLEFAARVTNQLLEKTTRDAKGARWIQAENRSQPDNLVAQTGYMQGAAGMATLLLRAAEYDQKKPAAFRLPDNPFPR